MTIESSLNIDSFKIGHYGRTLAFIHVIVNCIRWHHAIFRSIHIALVYSFANLVTFNRARMTQHFM